MPPPDPRSRTVCPGSSGEQGGRVAAAERGGDGVGGQAAGFGVGYRFEVIGIAASRSSRRPAAAGLRRTDRGDRAVFLANGVVISVSHALLH